MNAYVYHWSLRPEAGLSLELRVSASSVVVARREIRRFLGNHDGSSWVVEGVSREVAPLQPFIEMPLHLEHGSTASD